jgi:hypothetical protein
MTFVVLINFTPTGPVETTADVYRSHVSATEGFMFLQTIPLLGEQAVYFDTGAAFDTDTWYRIVGHPGEQVLVSGPQQAGQPAHVVVRDPLRPWADQDMDFCSGPMAHENCATPDPDIVWVGMGDYTRLSDATLLPISGSEVPADIYARRKDHAGSFRFLTRTLAAKDDVYNLFTAGGPLLLQLPPVYGQKDIYVQPGALEEIWRSDDQRRPFRMWEVPYEVVNAPVGPKQGTACANWCIVEETYATFADMTAAGGTWQDIATGDTVCP